MPNDNTPIFHDRLKDFDADWYLETYPDVAGSGLEAAEHFLLCGAQMNRPRNAAEAGRRVETGLPADLAATFGRQPSEDIPQPAAAHDADSPIVSAPGNLGPTHDSESAPAPRAGNSALNSLVLGGQILGRSPDADRLARLAGPLHLLARMTREQTEAERAVEMWCGAGASALTPAGARIGPSGLPELIAADFLEGPARIENAWFATTADLRLALAGNDLAGPDAAAGNIRAWQVDPKAPTDLLPVGGIELPAAGPAFLDLALHNPLLPVLLELSSPGGATLGFALLAFPSLLRGGLHAAERAAHQMGPHPIDEVWRQSNALLRDLLSGPRNTGFAVARLAVRCAGATGAEPIFSSSLRDWLQGVFALDLTPAETAAAQEETGMAWLRSTLAPCETNRGPGLTLELPPQAVPTLQALVARRMRLPEGIDCAAGPFLVSDMVGNRPLWSVSVPLEDRVSHDMPLLRHEATFAAEETAGQEPHWLAPLHLAVICRPNGKISDSKHLYPVAPDAPYMPRQDTLVPVTIVINVSDPELVGRALSSVKYQANVAVEDVLLCPALHADPEQVERASTLAETLFAGQVRRIAPETGTLADLDRILAETRSPHVLMMDEAVALQDTRILSTLAAELTAAEDIGAVSCTLMYEELRGKSTKLRFGSAGLFPSGVSFLGAPRLTVNEPDTLMALPASTYPVLANGFALCLIRRLALEATAPARADLVGAGSADLHFGLAARAAGWRSLCTSIVRAGTTRPQQDRDESDPFGLHCVAPLKWDELLRSITVLRELRG